MTITTTNALNDESKAVLLEYDDNPSPLVTVLKKLIPKTCLPSEFDDYQDLADILTVELSGTIVLVPKETWDRLTCVQPKELPPL